MSPTTFERASEFLGRALIPLADVTSDPDIALKTLADLGWQPPPGVDIAAALAVNVDTLVERFVAVLESTPEERADPAVMTPRYLELLAAIGEVLMQVDAVAEALPQILAGAGDYAEKTQIAAELPRRLLDYLVFVNLARAPQVVPAALQLLGVMRLKRYPRDDAIYQTAHDRAVVEWEQLGRLLSEPGDALGQEYQWGHDTFASDRLLLNLAFLLATVGVRAITIDASSPPPPGSPRPHGVPDVRLLLERGPGVPGALLGFEARRSSSETDPNDAGIEVVPYAGLGSVVLELADGLQLQVNSNLTLDGGIALRVLPSGVTLGSEAVSLTGQAAISLHYGAANKPPRELLTGGAGLAIQLAEAFFEIGAASRPQEQPDVWVRAGLLGCSLTVTSANGDGFLQQALPSEMRAGFDVRLRWSRRDGIALEGSGGLELSIPVQQAIGPVFIGGIHIGLHGDDGGLALEAGMAAALSLGPVKATVEDFGVEGVLTPGRGNLGPVDLVVGFKPPAGAGLSIDAGAVTGGGYLSFDPRHEQYSGVLRLEFGQVTLNAIGLLTTRLPDGSRGFSLLVIVQASGFAPIPLGLGFTLTGVGGLLGVNRTVALDVLRAGVRNRTLDSILFSPDDPTPRAPQIVSTLQTVFPPAPGRYVFGPMAQIGWGPPNAPVLMIEVALLLELPAPLRLIILGRIRAGLPTPAQAVVKLNLDVVGIIDFDRRELSVDATLYDSFVGPFALTGDMAARANWGERPDFALALGGFHPAFKPPAGFPELRRLALTLSTGNNPRLRMEAYLALTSNTVQLGARLDFYVAVAGFSLEGGFAFDTLISLSPFRLQAELDAGLTLKKGSRTLMHLSIHVNIVGPSPWEVWGQAKFKLLFISITVPFHAKFGRAEALPEGERTDVWALLSAELAKAENWAAQLPAADNRIATLIGEPASGEALVHPLGSLTVNQRSVPLERTLGLFGTAPPREAAFFEIKSATGLTLGDDLQGYFAPAQFRRMSDAEKLSSPGFDRMVSGTSLGPAADAVRIGPVQDTPLAYETAIVLDLDDPARETNGSYAPPEDAVASMAERGPAAVAEIRDQGRAKFAPQTTGPAVGESEYVVATRDTLEVAVDGHDGSYSGAIEALRRRADAEDLQVVRRKETELALV